MTQATSSYLKKGNDLENFRLISEGIYEAEEPKQIESQVKENPSSTKITCLWIGGVALIALGMVALIYKKAPKTGIGSILFSLPLFLFATQNTQSKKLFNKQSSRTVQEIFKNCTAKMYTYTAAKQGTVREKLKNQIFTSQDQLVREIQEFAERYDNVSVNLTLDNFSQKLRGESIEILPFIQKIASQENPSMSGALYPKWQALQKACRIFLNTEKGSPLIEIEKSLSVWKVKPAAVDLYT